MSRKTISDAVRAGLIDCLTARSPKAQLARYMAALRAAPSWVTADIAEVDRLIRQLLVRVANDENEDRDLELAT